MSIAPEVEGSEEAANKSYIRHYTSNGSSGSKELAKSLFLPIRVVNQRRTNQGPTRESHRSPMAAMTMKDC
jgi:hypothetical protein